MEDISISIIGIFIAVILMFVFPMMLLADRNDDLSQMIVQTETTTFVRKIITTGKFSIDDYGKYISAIGTSGNNYDVEITFQILDVNPGKVSSSTIGQTAYYTMYTSQIFDELNKNDENKENKTRTYYLKEGDIVTITAKNSSLTLSQSLRNFYYKVKGEDMHIIVGSHSGTVAVNGIS